MSKDLKAAREVTNAVRWEAQSAAVDAIKYFVKALDADIRACIEFEAAHGMTYQGFLEMCLTFANQNNASWSGGPHGTSNVIEAIVRQAWIEASSEMQIRNLFKH
jgi:hypothetical protein